MMMIHASVVQFLGGVSAAIIVKLASSIDDVLWLSAFLTPSSTKQERTKNAVTYALVCLLQTALAYILSQFGSSVIDDLLGGSDDQRMSTDRLLTLISGSALFIYSIILGVEYYQENFGEEEYIPISISKSASSDSSDHMTTGGVDHGGEVDMENKSVELGVICSAEDKETVNTGRSFVQLGIEGEVGVKVLSLEIEEEVDVEVGTDYPGGSKSNKHGRSLAIIAFLGSLDDLALFVPMLVGKAFGIIELMIGAMASAFFIVILCICLTKCKPVAGILERIPLVAIVATFSIILLTKGIFLMH